MPNSDNGRKSPPKNLSDLNYIAPKLTKSEIMEFAAYAIENADVVRILKEQRDGAHVKDDEIEVRLMQWYKK